jgi:hypothetical protein|tara:strand:+ start:111 stop:665 length:555 start_codon:yes stop_codon:yes gene_type:complete
MRELQVKGITKLSDQRGDVNMSNMNSRKRKIVYPYLKEKFGAYCQMCQALESERELVIDHIDNNNSNDNPNNWQFLCRSCNYIKNPRLKERKEPLDVCVGVSRPFDIPSEIKINREREPLFRKYVEEEVKANVQVLEQELINSGAEKLGLSPRTTDRYLKKMYSSIGKLQRIKTKTECYIIMKG